jgi:N-acetylglucosaminyl-diphospho-decaprenol L-rhamnosyltransferase
MINQKLSILIILYEENLEIINKCLEKIKDFKIIIIDNANNKSLKNEIIKKFKIYKYFLNKKNVGFSKAANQGIKVCDTEYLLFLGADCLITQSGIEQLMLAKEKYKDCFLTSPTFYDHTGKLTYNGGPLYENGAKNNVIKNYGDVCVDAVLTTVILFKVKDIIDIGLLDEEFFLYFLDDDLCRRIKNIKKSVVQVYASKAIHAHGHLKVKNRFKKIFFANYYFYYEELYYLYKINSHQQKYSYFKKKIPKFLVKLIINFFIFRFDKFVYYLSKTLAFYKFKKLIK